MAELSPRHEVRVNIDIFRNLPIFMHALKLLDVLFQVCNNVMNSTIIYDILAELASCNVLSHSDFWSESYNVLQDFN